MRYRKADIFRSIKSDLQVRFAPQDISVHSRLELFRSYFRLIELNSELVVEKLVELELPRIIVEFGGTVLIAGGTDEAQRRIFFLFSGLKPT